MKCEKCGGDLRVIDTADIKRNIVARRRRCVECRSEYYTMERIYENVREELHNEINRVRRERRRK